MSYNFVVNELAQKVAAALSGSNAGNAGKIAVGVSGGRDSMCLLHATLACDYIDKTRLLAVHVNHCLRDSADRDEKFVREFCQKHGVPFRAVRVDVKKEAAEKGLTVEQAARGLRYAVFYDMLKSGSDVVMTAHHALDNAESVLMHLFRGAGLDGLCAMDAKRIVRPFLDVYPDELDAYAKANGIEYVDDETNFSDAADRNFIRLKVLPLIEERYPGAVRAVNALSYECGEVRKYLDGSLDMSFIGRSRDAVTIKLDALYDRLAPRYVRAALAKFSLTDVTRADVDGVIALAKARTGARCELHNGLVAEREESVAAIFIDGVIEKCAAEVPVTLGANYIDGLVVDVTLDDADPKTVAGGAVDYSALKGGVLRFRRDGDVIKPIGGGTKKLKQYFIDKKIPKRMRDRIPLICRGSEVLVVVGYTISEKVKQTDGTQERAVIRQRW